MEQSDLGPYCLQYRLPKSIGRQEEQMTNGDWWEYTHYYNSNLIRHTVSRQVDEVIPLDHPRCKR